MTKEKITEKLTESEKHFLDNYLNSVSREKASPAFSGFLCFINLDCGIDSFCRRNLNHLELPQ